jgi:hypothetical protein
MQYVGNDIVDLTTPYVREKSRDVRFVTRVFTENERTLISGASAPDQMLWSLWAGKETAYKVMQKMNPGITAAPGRYGVTLREPECIGTDGHLCARGVVDTPDGSVPVMVTRGTDYIHCIGTLDDESLLRSVIGRVGTLNDSHETPARISASVRAFAKGAIARCMNCDQDAVSIVRSASERGFGPPIVYINDHKSDVDISLSHDGKFIAYAVLASHRITPWDDTERRAQKPCGTAPSGSDKAQHVLP